MRPPDLSPWFVWFQVGQDTAEAEFYGVWDSIRYLPGATPLVGALERARSLSRNEAGD
jgi:hypothetical protein